MLGLTVYWCFLHWNLKRIFYFCLPSQASVAVSYLNRIHVLKKRGAIPCSLYLDQIVKQSDSYKDKPVSFTIQKEKMLDVHVRKVLPYRSKTEMIL